MEHGNHQISFADKSSYFSNAFSHSVVVSPLRHCVVPPLSCSCVTVNIEIVNPRSHFCLCHTATLKLTTHLGIHGNLNA
ncbi:hypothetical protein JHK85_027929 [Glycine max]|nr:hypothetical protein JHK85_027929 [Glycine max]